MFHDYVFEYLTGLNASQADHDEIDLLSPGEIANLTYGGWDPSKFHKFPRHNLSTKNALIVSLYFGVILALILTAVECQKKRNKVSWKDSQLKGIGGLYLAVFLDSYGATMCIPYIGILTVQFGCTGFQATLVNSAFALAQTIGTVFLGVLADYINKKWILIMTLGFASVSLGLTGVCTQLPTGNQPGAEPSLNWAFVGLLISRAVGGFFASTVSIIETLIAEQSSAEKRTENIAQVMAYFSLGALAGPVIGGLVYDFGLQVLCYSSAAITFVNATWALISLDVGIKKPLKHSKAREKKKQEKKELDTEVNPVAEAFSTLNKQPFLYLLLFATIWATGAPTLSQSITGLFVLQVYQWGPLEIAGMFLYAGLVSVWAQMSLSGRSSENFGDAGSILAGNMLRCGSFLAYLLINPATPWVLAPLQAATGAMINAQLQSLLTSYSPPHAIGTLFGFMQACRSLGEAITPPLGGYMLDKDLLLPFKVSGIACAACGLLFLPFICMEPEKTHGDESDDSMTSYASSHSDRRGHRREHKKEHKKKEHIKESRKGLDKVQPFNWLTLLTKWLVPILIKMLSTLVCSFCMHVATYRYVNQMSTFEQQRMDTNTCDGASATPDWMVKGLQDTMKESVQGWGIEIHSFDQVMVLFPLTLFFLTVLTQDLHIWTKVLLSHSLFAFAKGILAVLTVMPDSSGWDGCKSKLQYDGIHYFTDEVRQDHVIEDILRMQFVGRNGDRLGSDVDYCTGSLFSAQTILFNFSCVYALALFELVRRQTMLRRVEFREAILIGLGVVFIAAQVAEVYLALAGNAFYSGDVLAAYILIFLCYTNAPLQLTVMWWCRLGDHSDKPKKARGPKLSGPWVQFPIAPNNVREEGDLFVPTCCVPFCLCDGYHHLVTVNKLINTEEMLYQPDDNLEMQPTENTEETEDTEDPLHHLQLENRRLEQEVKELRNILQIALPTV